MTAASLAFNAAAQNHEPILEFFETDAAEELSPYDVERMEDLLSRPLRINQVSSSKLEESGLFSHYQAASLSDYRSRHGDVLSLAELAAVDGFGSDFVARLAPFISLESYRLPGQAAVSSVRNDISVRGGYRTGTGLTYGLKYKLSAGERLSGGIAFSRTSDAEKLYPDAVSGHLAFHMKRHHGKIIAGDFNARFGQGLALWNGMSFSGLTSSSSFMRRPSGLSASSSFTGGYALRGIAAEMRIRKVGISILTAAAREKDGFSFMPAANLAWLMRNGRVSMTHYADFKSVGGGLRIPDMKTAADFAFCFGGRDVFGEIAYDWVNMKPASLGGTSFRLGDDVGFAAMLRYYPAGFSSDRSAAARSTTKCSNEYAVSAALDFSAGKWVTLNGMTGFGSSARRHSGKASADFAFFPESKSADADRSLQLKVRTEWSVMLTGAFRMDIRLSERVRTWGEPFRTDVRTDFSYLSGHWNLALRINALSCADLGLLGYFEGGYKAEKIALYLRQGFFRIDNWDDRIYAYERDAPGSFNVPAYYGRGLWTAFNMNWKFARWGRMYIRAAAVSYPFMAEKKPGRAELKFQFVFTL